MKLSWPFQLETRASDSYVDAIIAARLSAAGGEVTASVDSLAVVEACAGLWGRSFASAEVTPGNLASAALTPAVLESIGRRLLLRGEALFEIRVEDGAVRLVECSTWDISGRREWVYRVDISMPSGYYTRTLSANQVIHPRIGATSERPWEGSGPLSRSSATSKLAATLETKLTQEVGGPVGNVLPLPHTGSITALQADINKLAGRTVLVESTSGGYGDKDSAPKGDWLTRRIGADPPESMIGLRKDVQASILAACGCPGSLLERADGTLAREEMRRFLHSTISPVARMISGELAQKLDTPGLAFDFSALFASDLSGRARAFQSMVGGGMEISAAAALAGLMVDNDN